MGSIRIIERLQTRSMSHYSTRERRKGIFLISLEFTFFPTKVNDSFNIHFARGSFRFLEFDQMARRNTSTGFSRFLIADSAILHKHYV